MNNTFLRATKSYFEENEKVTNIILLTIDGEPTLIKYNDSKENNIIKKTDEDIVKILQEKNKEKKYEYVDSLSFGKKIIFNNKKLVFKGLGNSDLESDLLCFVNEDFNYLFVDTKNKYQISALISNLKLNKEDRCLYDLKQSTLPKNAEELKEKIKLITKDPNAILALNASLTEKKYPFGLPIMKNNLLEYGITDEVVTNLGDFIYIHGISILDANSIIRMESKDPELNLNSIETLKNEKVKRKSIKY